MTGDPMTQHSNSRVARLNPEGLASPVMNLYAQISIAPAGRLAFIAGQVALDTNGTLQGGNDPIAQARQCFLNLQRAIDAVGATPADCVQMRIHVVDHHPGLIAPLFAAGRAVFGTDWPLCASTYLGVQRLGLPEWRVEIDAVVTVPEGKAP
jgi:enamine deaminase RidA (YjgF/YER057c/UK114 family)